MRLIFLASVFFNVSAFGADLLTIVGDYECQQNTFFDTGGQAMMRSLWRFDATSMRTVARFQPVWGSTEMKQLSPTYKNKLTDFKEVTRNLPHWVQVEILDQNPGLYKFLAIHILEQGLEIYSFPKGPVQIIGKNSPEAFCLRRDLSKNKFPEFN